MLVPGFGGALLIGECRLAVVHVDVGIALEGGDIAIAEDAIVGHRSIFANSLSFLLVCILCGSTLGFLRAVGRPRARKLGGRFAGGASLPAVEALHPVARAIESKSVRAMPMTGVWFSCCGDRWGMIFS